MRKIILCIILFLLSGCAGDEQNRVLNPRERAARKNAGICFSGNCQNGEGVWKYDDGRRYEGSFIAGRPGGTGIVYLISGSEFSGRFKYGQYDGHGDVLYGNGVYADCQRGNCIDGRGVLMFEDGSRYSGGFQNEMRTGYGGMELEDGSTYSGDFLDGKYHGLGSLILVDGTEYKGQFVEGKMDGDIHIHFPTGYQFVGVFKGGEMVEGQGRVISPDNSRSICVEGNCVTGEGLLEFDDGSTYRGNFLNCSRHGYGEHTFVSGANYKGQFLKGRRHGKGVYTFPSGTTFTGEYKTGQRHGRGSLIFPDGTSYNVFYRKGKLVEKKY